MPKNNLPFAKLAPFKPSYYLSVPKDKEDLNTLYALLNAAYCAQAKRSDSKISIALTDPTLLKVAREITGLPTLPQSTCDVKTSLLDPPSIQVDYWEKIDKLSELDYFTQKYGKQPTNADEPFVYGAYLSILRDAAQIFDFAFGFTASAIFDAPAYMKGIENKSAHKYAANFVETTKPFVLIEEGFAGWKKEQAFQPWGDTIIPFPRYQDIRNNADLLLAYMGLIEHPQCAAVGLMDSDWLNVSVCAYNRNKNVIWDLRPSGSSNSLPEKDLTVLPIGIKVLALHDEMQDTSKQLIAHELAYAVALYYKTNAPSIVKGVPLKALPRPQSHKDPDFYVPWL